MLILDALTMDPLVYVSALGCTQRIDLSGNGSGYVMLFHELTILMRRVIESGMKTDNANGTLELGFHLLHSRANMAPLSCMHSHLVPACRFCHGAEGSSLHSRCSGAHIDLRISSIRANLRLQLPFPPSLLPSPQVCAAFFFFPVHSLLFSHFHLRFHLLSF